MTRVVTYEEMAEYGVVVWSMDADTSVTWNGSATFNVWRRQGDGFVNVDVFTSYGDPSRGTGYVDESAARVAAREWVAEWLDDVRVW